MKLKGNYTFDAPRRLVWQCLLDPEVIASILPGCEKMEETGENQYKAAMTVRVGPVQGKFQGTVQLSDLEEEESYHMAVEGRGPTGFLKGQGEIRLEDSSEKDKTDLHYDVEAQVGGRIASVGQRLIDTTARSITRQSLKALHQQIIARLEGSDAPDVKAPSATKMAAGVAKDVVKDLFRRKNMEEKMD